MRIMNMNTNRKPRHPGALIKRQYLEPLLKLVKMVRVIILSGGECFLMYQFLINSK
jgi:hypothetical protein